MHGMRTGELLWVCRNNIASFTSLDGRFGSCEFEYNWDIRLGYLDSSLRQTVTRRISQNIPQQCPAHVPL